ncbi:MBL fold metallo-hydrolase [Actinoplanes sp. NPDC048796]|uniref:MBL fold metallo-hydrolase n=1 Tax=Actinoplanes sp. NPDC048796 TaxID=3155640 RepID=UPI00340BD287
MRVRVLGSAAGGGCPQWNCACETCRRGHVRSQDSVAVSGDGRAWYLINASPDIRTQLIATPELRPGPGLRETPLRGVLLTTAELDHTIGLLSLREATSLIVYATSAVTTALAPFRALLAAYTNAEWRDLPTDLTLDGGLKVQRTTVGTKRPRYAAHLPGDDWVSALRLSAHPADGAHPAGGVRPSSGAGPAGGVGPSTGADSAGGVGPSTGAGPAGGVGPSSGAGPAGGVGPSNGADSAGGAAPAPGEGRHPEFVYATCLPAWTAEFDGFIAGADEVLVDGTFATEDELARMTGRAGSAAGMGHLPMADSRPHFARHPGTRFRYGHLNNTNAATGPDVAEDGIDLV